jgi:hypothetical protein
MFQSTYVQMGDVSKSLPIQGYTTFKLLYVDVYLCGNEHMNNSIYKRLALGTDDH